MQGELLPDEAFAPGNPQGRRLALEHLCCHQQGSSSPARTQTPRRPELRAPQGGQFLYSKANSLANQGFFFFLFFSEALGTQPCYLQSLICTAASFSLLPSHSLQFSHTLIS